MSVSIVIFNNIVLCSVAPAGEFIFYLIRLISASTVQHGGGTCTLPIHCPVVAFYPDFSLFFCLFLSIFFVPPLDIGHMRE